MGVFLEHHPSTIPRHALEAEVVKLRRDVDDYRELLRGFAINPDIPREYQLSCKILLNRT